MIESPISDRFQNDFANVFGVNAGHFSHGVEKPKRADIPQHQINRSNARSMGRATYQHTKQCRCGSFTRGTWSNKCVGCE